MEGSRQAYAVSFPPDRYYCLIDELPLHLVPQPARRLWREAPNAGLILNRDCELRDANDLPDEMSSRRDLVSGFALQGTIAWVRDAGGRTSQVAHRDAIGACIVGVNCGHRER